MTIDTKFNSNEKVWIINNGKAMEFPIISVKAETENSSIIISYFLNVGIEKDYKCKLVYEKECFHSREDLINSL